MTVSVSPKRTLLLAAARERILVLDGAMGTMIQALQYDEAAFRGQRFAAFHRDVRGNNDLLILTQPKAIEDIHADYLRAGADIVATNTFSSTSIAQADYDMSDLAYELNRDGAKLARAQVGRVDILDRLRLRQDQKVVVASDIAMEIRKALPPKRGFVILQALDHRAHGAVEHQNAFAGGGEQGGTLWRNR